MSVVFNRNMSDPTSAHKGVIQERKKVDEMVLANGLWMLFRRQKCNRISTKRIRFDLGTADARSLARSFARAPGEGETRTSTERLRRLSLPLSKAGSGTGKQDIIF